MKTIALVLIRVYQWLISPLLGAACRYTPTCSHYAAEALEYHGFFKGSALSAWRLLRCHPFAKGGLDTVPMPGRSPSAISRQRGYSFSKK